MGNKNNIGPGFVIGALFGGMIGAASALLLAPKKGEEIRQDLIEKLNITPQEDKPLSHMILEMGSEWAQDLFEIDETNNQEEDQGGGEVGYVVHNLLDNMDEQRGG
ncbi:YtxH domain-containing protein [Alkalihalobacterium elongatum]|uniref:YtxH domain-containing protein n=1 Tax=Alkalihalobacterium elongatum TaxID=2675466 RepID=UPI001C200EC0|nr:YtxH domain-containing protein [Alkalihalobacterium elongatum]